MGQLEGFVLFVFKLLKLTWLMLELNHGCFFNTTVRNHDNEEDYYTWIGKESL